ncbi:hypothetical protein BH11BAC6_BH11BAC6_17840 [soil metagenome]
MDFLIKTGKYQKAYIKREVEFIALNDFFISGNNLITIKSPTTENVGEDYIITTMLNSSTMINRNYYPVCIEVYDKTNDKLKNLVLPRYCATYAYSSMWPGVYMDGNTMHINYLIVNGMASLALKYYTVDINTMQVTSEHLIDDKNAIKIYVNAISILWFKDAFASIFAVKKNAKHQI